MELPSALFGLNPQKIVIFFPKKTRPENISYIFSKERFSIISGNGNLHFSAQARKKKKKKFTPTKFLIYSEKWNFLALIFIFHFIMLKNGQRFLKYV